MIDIHNRKMHQRTLLMTMYNKYSKVKADPNPRRGEDIMILQIHVIVLDSVCVLARSGSKVANCVFDTYDFVLHFCTLTFFFRGVFTAPVL